MEPMVERRGQCLNDHPFSLPPPLPIDRSTDRQLSAVAMEPLRLVTPLGDLVRRDKSFAGREREREQFEWRLWAVILPILTSIRSSQRPSPSTRSRSRRGDLGRDTGSLRKVSTQAEIERVVLLRRIASFMIFNPGIGTWVRVSIHHLLPPSRFPLYLSPPSGRSPW
jgi:hypothetical protein